MAPRTATFSTPQATTGHVVGGLKNSGIPTSFCHKKHSQQAAFAKHKSRRILKAQVVCAVQDDNREDLRHLLQHTGPNFLRGSTLMHVAAEHNSPNVTPFLMKYITPNVVNAEGYTPVHLAAMRGHTQVLREMLLDTHLDADKRDPFGYTYKQWLCVPLFDAVLKCDTHKVRDLLSVGADPDMEAGGLVGGALERELRVNTARQLALALGREQIFKMFGKPLASRNSHYISDGITSGSLGTALHQLPMGSLRLQVTTSKVVDRRTDVYRTDDFAPGYVCILNYSTFKGRPDLDLEGSETDVHNLGSMFSKMGYSGHAHFSLTADQTRQELRKLRDMKEVQEAACLVFVIKSHGTSREQFLTSDKELLHIQWVLDLFKESQCPHLKDKPKVFMWDLCHGYYREQENIQGMMASDHGRVDEPLRNVLCLYSSSGFFTPYTFTKDGTPFTKALCRTLAVHAHHKEFNDLYKAFLAEYSKAAPGVVPKLTNIGFSKKFFFNPRAGSNL